MKIFIYDESRALIRTVGTPDVMQGENNATLIFMSVAGIDESNFHDYLAQFAATIGTSRPADVITDFGAYVLDGVTYHGWKYLVSSKFTQVAGVLNANLVLSSGGSTLISQTVSLNVNPSASGVTWFKNITQAQWEQLLAYCVGLRNPNLGVLPDEGALDAYCEAGQAGAYLYVDNGGLSHLLFIGYDEAQDRVFQTDYYNDGGALFCRQRYTAEGDWDAWGNWSVNGQASAISFDDSKSELLAGNKTVQKAIACLGESFRPINFVPSLSAVGFSVVDGLDPKDKKIKDADGNNLDATGIKEYSYRKFNGNQNAVSTGKAVLFTDDGSIYELVVEETLVAYHFDGSPAELVAQAKSEQSAINQTLTDGVAANESLIKNGVVGNSAMTMDPTTYVITLTNTNLNGQVIGTYSVDIPAEMAFVSGRYDAEGKDLVFTLQNGSEVAVPVDDIFVGLATQDWVDAEIENALVPYATSSWVNSAITNALVPYATSSWVDSNYVSLTKGGYVSMAESPASASAYYFGAKNGNASFIRLADDSFDAKTTKGDVSMMFSLNYSSSNKARFTKIDSSESPAAVSVTEVPFKNGVHSLVLDDDLAEAESRIEALEADNEVQKKQLQTQRLEILDLKESTYQGLSEYEDTASFTENLTPIPNLLNDRKVVHGVRAILSSLDGDTKKVVASDNSEPTLMGFKPKSVKMIGSEYSKDFVVGEKVRYMFVPSDFQQEWSDIVLNSPTYGNVRFKTNSTGSAFWCLVDSASGSTVYQSNQSLYGKDAIVALPEEMTFSKWFNETRKWGDGIIKNVVGQDLIPTSLLNVTLNKAGTAKDQLIVHQQENGLFGVKHRKEVGEVDLGTLEWNFDGAYSRWHINMKNEIKENGNNSVAFSGVSEKYETVSIDAFSGTIDNAIGYATSGTLLCKNGSSTIHPSGNLVYELATPTETTIATDLSLSQVSALQNAGYSVEIEAETMKYGVRGSANLTMLTKGE